MCNYTVQEQQFRVQDQQFTVQSLIVQQPDGRGEETVHVSNESAAKRQGSRSGRHLGVQGMTCQERWSR